MNNCDGCKPWNNIVLMYKTLGKLKRRIWKLLSTTHNSTIHNITSNIQIILEKRFIKFIHSALNGNIVCRQISLTKLRCKKSSFAENNRDISWKYNISDCDCYTDVTCLMGKVSIIIPLYHTVLLFHVIYVQYRSASLSINPASRAGACTDCEYIECTIAIIIIVILVQTLFLVDIMCSFD